MVGEGHNLVFIDRFWEIRREIGEAKMVPSHDIGCCLEKSLDNLVVRIWIDLRLYKSYSN